MRKFSIVMALVITFLLPTVAIAKNKHAYMTVCLGDSEVLVPIESRLTGSKIVNRSKVESYSAFMDVTIGLDEDTNLVVARTTLLAQSKAASSTNKEKEMASIAFRWYGEINYDKVKVNGIDCYKPTSFANKITNLDNQFTATKLSAKCIGVGWGYTNAAGDGSGYIHEKSFSQTQSNPVSGKLYTKATAFNNYFSKSSSTIEMNGTFNYKRRLVDGTYKEYKSSNFSVTLCSNATFN